MSDTQFVVAICFRCGEFNAFTSDLSDSWINDWFKRGDEVRRLRADEVGVARLSCHCTNEERAAARAVDTRAQAERLF